MGEGSRSSVDFSGVFDPDLDRLLRQRLRALDDPADLPPWNLIELEDLLPSGTSLRPAAVLIGLLPDPAGPRVVLTRRTDDLPHHAGQIAFPGGRREPKDPGWLDTASREAEEEVGVRREQIRALGLLAPYATISGFAVTPVVAWLEGEFAPIAQDSEVAEIFDVPLAWLIDPSRRRWEKVHWRGRERGYWVIDYERYRIWGATAAMLVDLARVLGEGAQQ